MALRLNDLNKTRPFISESDPDKDNEDKATVFSIRSLTSSEMAYLNDRLAEIEMNQSSGEQLNRRQRRQKAKAQQKSQTTRLNIFDVALECVRIAVVDIKNLQGADGKPIQFKAVDGTFNGRSTKVVPDMIMDAFDTEVAMEIYEFVQDNDTVSEEDAKN